jgi:hypothetical protein
MTKKDEATLHLGAKTVTVELSIVAHACLTKLWLTGLYGATVEEAAQRIIEERVRGMVEIKR